MRPLRAFLLSFAAGLAVLFGGYGTLSDGPTEVIGLDGRRSIVAA